MNSPGFSPIASAPDDDSSRKPKKVTTIIESLAAPLLDVKADWLITYGTGASGKHQVLAYDQDNLIFAGGLPCIFIKASIFRLRKVLGGQVALLVVVTLSSYALMKSLNPSLEKTDIKYWTQQMDPLFQLANYMNSLVAFTLGLFMGLTIQRWWILRASYVQGLVKSIRNIVFSISAVLHHPTYDSVRQNIMRRCFLGYRLLFLCAYGRVGEAQLRELCDQGLLDISELRELISIIEDTGAPDQQQYAGFEAREFDTCLAEVPWLWNARQCFALFKAGSIPPPMMSLLHGLCKDAQNSIENVRMQMNSQLPFSYCHLVAILVQGSSLLSAIRCGMQIALADSVLRMVCLAMFSFCLSAVYLGLFTMTAVLADPFGDDVIDFPVAHMEAQLWKGCQLLEIMKVPPEDVQVESVKHHHSKDDDDDEDDSDDEDEDEGDEDGDDGGD